METRPGIYTTEFWLAVLTWIGVLLNLFGVWDWTSNWHSGIIGVVVTAAYIYSRGQAKQGVPADPAMPGNFRLFPRQRDFLTRK